MKKARRSRQSPCVRRNRALRKKGWSQRRNPKDPKRSARSKKHVSPQGQTKGMRECARLVQPTTSPKAAAGAVNLSSRGKRRSLAASSGTPRTNLLQDWSGDARRRVWGSRVQMAEGAPEPRGPTRNVVSMGSMARSHHLNVARAKPLALRSHVEGMTQREVSEAERSKRLGGA